MIRKVCSKTKSIEIGIEGFFVGRYQVIEDAGTEQLDIFKLLEG